MICKEMVLYYIVGSNPFPPNWDTGRFSFPPKSKYVLGNENKGCISYVYVYEDRSRYAVGREEVAITPQERTKRRLDTCPREPADTVAD